MTMEGATTRAGGMNGGQGEQLRHAAADLADQAARTAEAQASTTMTKVGQTLDRVAGAIRKAGEDLREEQPDIAGFATTAADRVQDAAAYLRDHEAGEALTGIQDFARRQPALVIGGGLALGILVGRFLRSGATGTEYGGGYGIRDQYGYDPRRGAAGYTPGAHGSGEYGTAYGADLYGGVASTTGMGSTTGYPSAGETTSRYGGQTAEAAGHGTTLRETAQRDDLGETLTEGETLEGETLEGKTTASERRR